MASSPRNLSKSSDFQSRGGGGSAAQAQQVAAKSRAQQKGAAPTERGEWKGKNWNRKKRETLSSALGCVVCLDVLGTPTDAHRTDEHYVIELRKSVQGLIGQGWNRENIVDVIMEDHPNASVLQLTEEEIRTQAQWVEENEHKQQRKREARAKQDEKRIRNTREKAVKVELKKEKERARMRHRREKKKEHMKEIDERVACVVAAAMDEVKAATTQHRATLERALEEVKAAATANQAQLKEALQATTLALQQRTNANDAKLLATMDEFQWMGGGFFPPTTE